MITFDELRISEDKQALEIKCHVQEYDIYDNVFIKEVWLENYKNRDSDNPPSDKAYLVYQDDGTGEHQIRELAAVVQCGSLPGPFDAVTFEDGLFYVYVICDGTFPPEEAQMSCGYFVPMRIGIVPDWYKLYKLGMQYVAKIANGCNHCELPDGFEHFILIWNAFRLAVQTSDWASMETLWPKLIASPDSASGRGCGCNA